MTATELSSKQQRILRAIEQFIDRHGYPPSHRDLMRLADISSTSVVAYNLRLLRDRGLVELPAARGRALRLIGPAARYEIMVPLIGEMRPDRPLAPYMGEPDDWPTVAVAAASIRGASAHVFAVRVWGSTFWDVSLAEEDIVLIDGRDRPIDPDPDGTYVVWRPDRQETAIVPGRDIGNAEVQGRVCGMMRLW